MIIDTHAHLNTKEFDQEIPEIIERACQNDVQKIIVIGMNSQANLRGLELTKYKNLYATVGLHPVEIEEGLDLLLIKNQLKHEKVVAIGEIGIDLYWNKVNLEEQSMVFKKQLDLALELNLPVVIHMRDSAQQIYDIVQKYPGLKGVMHCFSESLDWAMKFVDLGLYIGIGGPVTFKNNEVTKHLVKGLPFEKIVVETDSPYLAPMPHRGKRNEPAFTRFVVEEIAKLREVSVDIASKQTTENAMRLFNIQED